MQVLSPTARLRYIDRVKTNLLANPAQPSASNCFRLFLQAELGRRCARNSQYSLRAFATFLAIDHATLSHLLRRKRSLTPRTILRLGTRLGLDRATIDLYVANECNWRQDAAGDVALNEMQQLADDAAHVIADWYHYAILELTRLQDFKPDSRWVARVLGITTDQVNLALTRLLRLGLLKMAGRDRWIDKSGDTTASLADFSRSAVQQLSQQVRQLMLGAIENVPSGRCEFSSTTLAVSTERLPAVLERIARFRRELVALLEQDGVRNDVYQLEINFFPMTRLQHETETTHGTTRDAVADPGKRT
jgi:uncharacterized protein (TIGR02147 family)